MTHPLPRTFARRTTVSVILMFLVTMIFFLSIAYRSERARHLRDTFQHMDEIASVLLPSLGTGKLPAGDGLAVLERRLSEKTGTPHRILITGAGSAITHAADRQLLGRDFRELFELESDGQQDGRAFASRAGAGWYVLSVATGSGAQKLVLLQSRAAEARFARQFWLIHGLHVGITIGLFFLLLRFLGERFVRRPIEQLAAHVDRVRTGEFETRPESYRKDEFGWLADRFTEMGLELRDTVEQLVRSEKSATAAAVAYRVAHDVQEPLSKLRRHLAYLEGLSGSDETLMSVARALRVDLHVLVQAIVRLEELMPKSDANAENDQEALVADSESAQQ